jgi:hypothetical protein
MAGFQLTLHGRFWVTPEGIKINVIGSLALSLGILIMLPLSSATEAQSSKQTASGQTKHAIVDNGVGSLQQLSTSMELLSKRVRPSDDPRP